MTAALYGPRGFYLSSGAPARHFRTAAHVAARWADALCELAQRVDTALGSPPDFAVVDVGAGGGELLTRLAGAVPEHWRLYGVDLAPRPVNLPARVGWQDRCPDTLHGLLLAGELLDVVPVDVVELTAHGPRLVEVTPGGQEVVTDTVPTAAELAWIDRWWPLAELGSRAELGGLRDALWHQVTSHVDRGVAIAIDYAADPCRDRGGTLTGYRDGRQVVPAPDGSCDLTAHVRFDSLMSDGDLLLRQRDALGQLGVDAEVPTGRGKDPAAYLVELSAAGEAAELLDPGGLGGFTWLVHSVGVTSPLRASAGR
jgi:SAM-dependent MidA family methyltransferase